MNALLPALNSPTTTSRNSSSSWRIDAASAAWSAAAAPNWISASRTVRQQLTRLVELGLRDGIEDAEHA